MRSLSLCLIALLSSSAVLSGAEGNEFQAIDRHALATPAEAERSIEELAKYLTKPAKNDREKVRALYRWITDRIAYDAESFFAGKTGDTSAPGVLTNRVGVCEGYASLFLELCKAAEIEAVKVRGKAKGYAADPLAHTWNAVKLDDRWHLIDPTWGAGDIRDRKFRKQFQESYFLAVPDQLIFSHLPRDARWQLLDRPLSEDAFLKQPRVNALFFRMGVKGEAIRKVVEDGKELAKVFDQPVGSITLHEAPMHRRLEPGTKYRFRIEAPDFTGITIAWEGKTLPLSRKGKVYEGVLTAPKGTITVRGVVANMGKPIAWTLLEYAGE
jgi:hypothetical protein